MKTHLRLTALLVMVASMAFAAAGPATAQSTPSGANDALEELIDGAAVYSRTYMGDMGGNPEPGSGKPVMAHTVVYEFPDDTTATEARPLIEQVFKDEMEPSIGAELDTVEVEDLADVATMSSAEMLAGVDETVSLATLIVQQGEVIYVSISMVQSVVDSESQETMPPPANGMATDFMTFMLDSEPGDTDAVEFEADGTSTGGYFDVFPTDEDTDLLQGLMVAEDMYETTN